MDEDWKAKEDKFHLSQALERAMIRIKDNRAKPIDILALNLMIATKSTFDSVFSSNIQTFLDSYSNVISEPYLITINLSLEQLSELATDILLYKSLEKDTRNSNFWNAMSTIVSHQISLLESNNDSIQSSILQDVEKLTMNKSFKQLCTLESQIQEKLDRGGNIDVEYWQQILKNLNVWKSKARVKEMYNFMLKEKQESSTKSISTAKTKSIQVSPGIFIDIEIGAKSAPIEEYDPTMSPILTRDLHRDDSLMDIEDEEKDYLNILSHRKALLKKIQKRPSGPVVDPHFQAFLTNEGSDISQDQLFLFKDKYRPRKPFHSNKVITGIEWNKYNETHYNETNPPPKVIQGYQFNIHYPDLIDKSIVPTYVVEPDPEKYNDCAMIRFIAGPPYQDIAFRIVDKEWEYAERFGFNCQFENGVLLLHFNFRIWKVKLR